MVRLNIIPYLNFQKYIKERFELLLYYCQPLRKCQCFSKIRRGRGSFLSFGSSVTYTLVSGDRPRRYHSTSEVVASSLACDGAEIFNFESKLESNFVNKRSSELTRDTVEEGIMWLFPMIRMSECSDPPEDETALHTTSYGIRPVEV
jgi:hypothetical protein